MGYNEPRQSGQPSSALTVRHLPLDGMYKGCPLCRSFFSGRGRPRRMYRVVPEYKFTARKLARLWEDSVAQKNLILAEQEQTFFYSGVL